MNKNPGIVGRKLGFTQFFNEQGDVERVSVIHTGPVLVASKRTVEKDGYTALVLGLGDAKEKHLNKAQLENFKKAGQTPKRTLKELRCNEDFAAKFEVGATIKLSEVFTAGQLVDAQGTTRGRGFTGVMRRWNFAGFPRAHGTHEYQRHGGSIGTNMTPGRTLPNIKMGGQYGNETVSMLNLRLVRIDDEKNLLMIQGGIPGAKNGLVTVRHAVKTRVRRAH